MKLFDQRKVLLHSRKNRGFKTRERQIQRKGGGISAVFSGLWDILQLCNSPIPQHKANLDAEKATSLGTAGKSGFPPWNLLRLFDQLRGFGVPLSACTAANPGLLPAEITGASPAVCSLVNALRLETAPAERQSLYMLHPVQAEFLPAHLDVFSRLKGQTPQYERVNIPCRWP